MTHILISKKENNTEQDLESVFLTYFVSLNSKSEPGRGVCGSIFLLYR